MRRRIGRVVSASIVITSPTAACSTYCSDVASTIAGTMPSAPAPSSRHGFASPVAAHANRKRPASMNDCGTPTTRGRFG